VEGFFAKLSRRCLKHGVFRFIVDLQGAINRFVAEHNDREAKPFIWRADPDAIIAARNRGFQALESNHCKLRGCCFDNDRQHVFVCSSPFCVGRPNGHLKIMFNEASRSNG